MRKENLLLRNFWCFLKSHQIYQQQQFRDNKIFFIFSFKHFPINEKWSHCTILINTLSIKVLLCCCHSCLFCHITVRKCTEATHSIWCDDNSLNYSSTIKMRCTTSFVLKIHSGIESLHDSHVRAVPSTSMILSLYECCSAAFTW